MTAVRRLTGVYNARGSLLGELEYAFGKLIGRAHCGLCDVTHGLRLRERPEWVEHRAGLAVPFETVHLDERSVDVAAACPEAPCVVAHTDDGLIRLLGPEEIDACHGEPAALVASVRQAAEARALTLEE